IITAIHRALDRRAEQAEARAEAEEHGPDEHSDDEHHAVHHSAEEHRNGQHAEHASAADSAAHVTADSLTHQTGPTVPAGPTHAPQTVAAGAESPLSPSRGEDTAA